MIFPIIKVSINYANFVDSDSTSFVTQLRVTFCLQQQESNQRSAVNFKTS